MIVDSSTRDHTNELITSSYISVGLPKPVNLHMINFTNTSITLTWEYPPPPVEPIENFLVCFILLAIIFCN